MGRVIMSEEIIDGKTVNVTPEAINRFRVAPIQLMRADGEHEEDGRAYRCFEVTLQANVSESAPVLVTLVDEVDGTAVTAECDENEFARSMIDAIVTKHGDIDDVEMLKKAEERLAGQIAFEFWQKSGIIYTHLIVPGFGFIEANNEVVAVTDGVKYSAGQDFIAINCTNISSFENMGKGHLHFLPKGTDRFLVFDLQVVAGSSDTPDGERSYVLNADSWPAPSKERPVEGIPKSRGEYANADAYLDAVTKYIQAHMCVGNDRRVELENDLIF